MGHRQDDAREGHDAPSEVGLGAEDKVDHVAARYESDYLRTGPRLHELVGPEGGLREERVRVPDNLERVPSEGRATDDVKQERQVIEWSKRCTERVTRPVSLAIVGVDFESKA